MALFRLKSPLQQVFNKAGNLYAALDALEKESGGKFKVVETRAFVTDDRDLEAITKLAAQTDRKISVFDERATKQHMLNQDGFLCIETNIPGAGLDKAVKLVLKKDLVEAFGTAQSQMTGHPTVTVQNIAHPSSVQVVMNYVRDMAQQQGMI